MMGVNTDNDLKLLLKLDGDVLDSSGFGNDGVLNGTGLEYTEGKFGKALSRTLFGDNVNCGVLGLQESTNQTLAGWARFDGEAGGVYLISCRDGSVGGLTLYLDGEVENIYAMRGVAMQTGVNSPSMVDGEFHHYAIVYEYNGGSPVIHTYADGELLATDTTLTGTWDATKETRVFERGESQSDVDASADDIRVYSRALSAGEIKVLASDPYKRYNLNDDPTLEVLYRMDDPAGSTVVADSSRHGRDGTLAGGSIGFVRDDGKFGGSLLRISEGDEVVCPALGLQGTNHQTIAAFVKSEPGLSNNVYIVACRTGAAGGLSLLWLSDSKIYAVVGTTPLPGKGALPNIGDGKWHHVAIVYDTVEVRYYLDGKDLGVDAVTGTWDSSLPTHLFEREYWDIEQEAQLDDVRIYSRALSHEEVKALANDPYKDYDLNNSASLELFAKFDGSVKDDSKNQYPGSLVGLTGEYVDGPHGKALTFDGVVNHHVSYGTAKQLDFTSEDFSVAFWMNRNVSKAGEQWIIGRGRYEVSGWGILSLNDRLYFHTFQDAGTAYSRLTITSLEGKWTHVVIVRKGEDSFAYVNGVEHPLDVVATIVDPVSSSNDLLIGVLAPGSSQVFNGLLDDIRVYSRVLTEEEILNIARCPYLQDLNRDPSLQLHYKFDEKTGNVAVDSSEYGRSVAGVNIVNAGWVKGKFGNAYQMVNNGHFRPAWYGIGGANPRTIAFWVKGRVNAYRGLYSNAGSGQTYLIAQRDDGIIYAKLSDGSDYVNDDSSKTEADVWHHVAFVFDGISRNEFWFDGVLKATLDLAINSEAGANVYVNRSREHPGTGMTLDDFRIYSRALAPHEIKSLATDPYAVERLDNVDTPPYYIFDSGEVPEDVNPLLLTWSESSPANKYDWSGIAIRQTSTSTTRKALGGLITPKHMAIAKHNGTTGLTYAFMERNGNLHYRVANTLYDVPGGMSGTDIRIMELDAELPSGCKVYPVLTESARLDGYGILFVEPGHEVIMQRIKRASEGSVYHHESYQRLPVTGSGNPVFAAINNELFFIGTNWTEDLFMAMGYYRDDINVQLSPYSLNVVEAPIVETRRRKAVTITSKTIPVIGAL